MDVERLGKLVARHGGPLELYARQFCRCAEDVVQEAFLKLTEQKAPLDDEVTWLFRVVRNGAISAGRSERRREGRERSSAPTTPWFEEDMAARLDGQSAKQALLTLNLDEREVIIAHVWGGLTFEQIGAVHGFSAATAFRRYEAGLNQLRTRLEAPCTIPAKNNR